jgi:hypothetical protein
MVDAGDAQAAANISQTPMTPIDTRRCSQGVGRGDFRPFIIFLCENKWAIKPAKQSRALLPL